MLFEMNFQIDSKNLLLILPTSLERYLVKILEGYEISVQTLTG